MSDTTDNKDFSSKLPEAEILNRVAHVACSNLDLRNILDTIVHITADALDKDTCSVCILKPEKKIICIEATRSIGTETVNSFCVKDDEGVLENIFRDLTHLAIEDIREKPYVKSILNPATEYLSLLAVPLKINGNVSGMLMLQTLSPHSYTETEISLLTIISHFVSSAIKNAELYRNVRAQLDELKVIHEISKTIASILNIDELLPYMCEEIKKAFNADICILRLFEGNSLQIKASHGLPEKTVREIERSPEGGIALKVALTGEPLLMNGSTERQGSFSITGVDLTSAICVPLKIGDKISGTIELYNKRDEWGLISFSSHDINSLITFASASAIALENSRLYMAELEREKEVTETKDYLKSLIDGSADAIITSDTNGIILSWNRGAENIYGFTEDEVLGKFLPMVPHFLADEEKAVIEKIKQKEILRNIETIRQTKSGKLIEVSLTLSPVFDSLGNVTAISGISRDISQKKIVEKELIRKNQELSRLFFINSAVRNTLDLSRLLRMVLTVVTMGDGLGFNRAILFLVDESDNVLNGIMGVGPATPEEANRIWVSMEGKSLNDIIAEIEKTPAKQDSHLDTLSKKLCINLSDDSILSRCVEKKKPFNVHNAKTDSSVTPYLIQMLGAESFGLVPLLSRDKVIGVIWVDNIFTGRPIRDEDLNFLTEFSSNIASAIENARLFENVSITRAELRNIFESITDMVYFTDKDYTIKRINHAVVKKIGKPESEIVGRKCYEIFHGRDEPLESCPHYITMNTKKPFVGELEDPNLGGTFVMSNSPIFDSSGNFIGTVHISRDITELRTLRDRVIQAERMAALGELAARVAHEIRNPLISIGGFARRLEKRLSDDTKEYAKIIVNEVTRLENILKEILGFVKTARIVKETLNVNQLIENTVDLIMPELDKKNNTIVKDLSDEPLIATIDPDKIKESILNILTNSNQATENGTIRVVTSHKDSEALIEISDNGCGIKDEDLKNIFNPFFTTKSGGTGLGLAITHKIIEEHKGRIEVDSKCGRGTVFRISLPLKNE